MKNTFLIIAILISTTVFAQKEKEMILNKETNLIEATYYHDNGEISQKGTFNLERKLQGEWISYNEEGEQTSLGHYANGVKTGKWFFWDNGIVKEVEYNNNIIASVDGVKSTSRVATKH